ncbi:MAG: T9SS type A sorting domain-containing protein [Ignavibacteriaceae bacterium]|nr:T9SS type A sorting domain-containing protein [Ignavibacteriaceae bacterium]
MFDIRYSSGRIAEDINGSVKTIDMSGVTYPLTVRVEGMDIRLMDESGKNVNVNLKSGEDVVIDNSNINKLMVSGELVPAHYALEQNYPNPFNPSTVIEFSLPEDVANVKLSIYNMLGEKVGELVNTSLQAGKYQYQWNASNVATGMYIYELRTDNFVSVKKMLLIK